MPPEKRAVKLNFDALHHKLEIAFDPASDRVVGPNADGNLCLMTGILDDYEIPVW